MAETEEPQALKACGDTAMSAWIGREAEDVPPGWMDNVVRRLLEQVNRQLIRFEDAKFEASKNDEASRDMSSQSLHRLELTLSRLIRFETQRAALRTSKASSNAGALEEFKRKFDALVAASGSRAPDEGDE